MQENNLNLFDLLLVLDETYPWETLHCEHNLLTIEILARLIAKASLPNHDKGNDHE
jgi:hypothetical protein